MFYKVLEHCGCFFQQSLIRPAGTEGSLKKRPQTLLNSEKSPNPKPGSNVKTIETNQ